MRKGLTLPAAALCTKGQHKDRTKRPRLRKFRWSARRFFDTQRPFENISQDWRGKAELTSLAILVTCESMLIWKCRFIGNASARRNVDWPRIVHTRILRIWDTRIKPNMHSRVLHSSWKSWKYESTSKHKNCFSFPFPFLSFFFFFSFSFFTFLYRPYDAEENRVPPVGGFLDI